MMSQKSQFIYSHKKQYRLEVTQKVSFCYRCSTAIIKDKSGNEITAIKPLRYHIPQETCIPIFLTISDKHNPYLFYNKSDYIKIRRDIVKQMKLFCQYFELSKKTFFLALDYFDRILTIITTSKLEDLMRISQLCIILAAKFQENCVKGMQVKKLSMKTSTNYAQDELFLLRLLDYKLHTFTCYDILVDMLNAGFLFNDEDFSIKKMDLIYDKIESMLYLFSESKYYIDWTHKEIALATIGLIRESFGLPAFSKNIKSVFMNEFMDIYNYSSCLNRLRKCFKFLENDKNKNAINNHSDSTTESNSDNGSDISDYNLKNKSLDKNIINSKEKKNYSEEKNNL